MKKIKKLLQKNNKKILYFLPFLSLLIIDSFYCLYNSGFFYDYSVGLPFIISLIITYSIMFIFLFITKSFKKSNIFLLILYIIILIINQIKIYFTYQPFYLSDIYHIFSLKEIVSVTSGTMGDAIKSLFPNIIFIFLFICLIIFIFRCFDDYKLNSRKHIIFIVSILILIIINLPIPIINKTMKKIFFNSENIKDYSYYTNDIGYYTGNGIIGGMYGQLLETNIFKSDDYDETILNNGLKKYDKEEVKNNSELNPNIIVVFCESFWNIDLLDEVSFDKKVASNFEKISKSNNSKLYNMISPSYGGISSNVEFELLTGFNTAFYSKSYIPYIRLYNNNSFYNKNSIIKELNNNGYYTKVIAPTKGSYNPANVYNYFGLNDFEILEKYISGNSKGYNLSDEFVINKLIENIKNKDNVPSFYMTITMQNHMPYLSDKYNEYDISIKNSNLKKEYNDVLLSYAQGVYDSDKSLGVLYDFIMSYKEPSVVIFLGDHLPFLSTTKRVNVIDKLNYFNTTDELENLYRKYNIQALVFSNYNIDLEDYNYIGPDTLLPYVMNKNNLYLSNYYRWLLDNSKELVSFNRYVSIDNKDNKFYTKDIKGSLLEKYKLRNNMQYKLLIK